MRSAPRGRRPLATARRWLGYAVVAGGAGLWIVDLARRAGVA